MESTTVVSAAAATATPSITAASVQPSLSILPQRLVLVKTRGNGRLSPDLDTIRGSLQRLLFFGAADQLLSYTETDDEVSLLLDERSFARFPADSLVVSPGVWRAIELYQGPSAVETVGIVSSVSAPLAARDSALEMLVLSTFATDLVLVKHERISDAFAVLQQNLKMYNAKAAAANSTDTKSTAAAPTTDSKQSAQAAPQPTSTSLLTVALQSKQSTNTKSAQQSGPPSGTSSGAVSPFSVSPPVGSSTANGSPASLALAPSAAGKSTAGGSGNASGAGANRLSLSVLPNRLRLLGFKSDAISSYAYAILAILLDENSYVPSARGLAQGMIAKCERPHFFSFTAASGDISLVIDQNWIDSFSARLTTPVPAPTTAADTKSTAVIAAGGSGGGVGSSSLKVHSSEWTSLMVLDGSSGYNNAKVSQLSTELARAGISIYYVSSVDADYVLVLTTELERAMTTLNRINIRVDTIQ